MITIDAAQFDDYAANPSGFISGPCHGGMLPAEDHPGLAGARQRSRGDSNAPLWRRLRSDAGALARPPSMRINTRLKGAQFTARFDACSGNAWRSAGGFRASHIDVVVEVCVKP